MNHRSGVHTVAHNGVANLYVTRNHFSAPIQRSLARHVPIDILSYERTAVAFHSAGALIHLAVRTLRLDRAFKGMLRGIFLALLCTLPNATSVREAG
jgi:hypothetical protein